MKEIYARLDRQDANKKIDDTRKGDGCVWIVRVVSVDLLPKGPRPEAEVLSYIARVSQHTFISVKNTAFS